MDQTPPFILSFFKPSSLITLNFSTMNSSLCLSLSDQLHLLQKINVFKVHGRDRAGHTVLLIVGKYFPARFVSSHALTIYLNSKILPSLKDRPFSVVYLHTDVHRTENFPGISNLNSVFEAIPMTVKNSAEAVYFVHPGFQTRLFLATVGRFVLGAELYKKVKYVKRVEFLWEYVRRGAMELPEFVYDHDEELEYYPLVECDLESDYLRVSLAAPWVGSAVSTYSMRCMA